MAQRVRNYPPVVNRSQEGKHMKTNRVAVAAIALTALVSSSAFADSRPQDRTWRDGNDRRSESSRRYRDNERVTVQGRVSRFTRERDGYRVWLDRGNYSYWVPSSRMRGRNLSVGLSVVLGGIFRGDVVYVDDLGYAGGYGRDYVSGVVERIDYRRANVTLRDQRAGRYVTVDMDRLDRNGRGVDFNDLRRGDYVTIAGDWERGNVFEAFRIDSVRNGRY